MQENWNPADIDLTGFLHYMREPGTATDNASISKVFTQLGINDQMLRLVLARPGVREFLKQRYQPKPIALDSLRAMPSDSFGHQWAVFMQSNNLNPGFFRNLKEHDDRSYLINRLHDTHDMWHVLLGFDTSEAGEAGMNAFTYAQVGSPTTCMLMAAKLVRAIGGPEPTRSQMMRNIARGYELGMRLDPFVAIAWEEHWAEPLRQLRQRVGLIESDF